MSDDDIIARAQAALLARRASLVSRTPETVPSLGPRGATAPLGSELARILHELGRPDACLRCRGGIDSQDPFSVFCSGCTTALNDEARASREAAERDVHLSRLEPARKSMIFRFNHYRLDEPEIIGRTRLDPADEGFIHPRALQRAAEALTYLLGMESLRKDTAKKSSARPLVCFQGPTNAGKTSLAMAMFGSLLAMAAEPSASASVYWRGVYARCFLAEDLAPKPPFGEIDEDLIEAAKTASLIVIDEVGEESIYAGKQPVIAGILAERFNHVRPSILTVATSGADLTDRYGGGKLRRMGRQSGILIDCSTGE